MEEKKEIKKQQEYVYFEEDEIDLYELWLTLKKRWKVVIGTFLIFTVAAVVIAFVMTPVYRATTTLMPVSATPVSGMAALASEALGIQLQKDNTSSKIMAVLKSKTIRERVIKNLNLIPVLLENIPENRDPMYVAQETLEEMVSVSQDRKTNLITLNVDSEDRELAKKIAEEYIKELQNILEEKALTIAKVNRIFLEKQLAETERELQEALNKMVAFQKEHKIINPSEQVKGSFELYSSLISQKIQLQTEYRKLSSVLSPNNPRLKAIRQQLASVNKQLKELEGSTNELSPIPSLNLAPELMSSYTKLYLKLKALQTKYETLLKMYEQARIEEQKEAIYAEVIDPPYASDIPVKPKKKLIVAVAGVSGLFLGIFLAFFLEWLENVRRRHAEA